MENKKIYINDIELPKQPTELNIEHCFNFICPNGSCDCSIKIKDQELLELYEEDYDKFVDYILEEH